MFSTAFRTDKGLPVEPAKQGLDRDSQFVFFAHELLYPLLGVDHRGVVLPVELLSDGGVAEPGDPPGQVHGYLPGSSDPQLPAIPLDVPRLSLHLLRERPGVLTYCRI